MYEQVASVQSIEILSICPKFFKKLPFFEDILKHLDSSHAHTYEIYSHCNANLEAVIRIAINSLNSFTQGAIKVKPASSYI